MNDDERMIIVCDRYTGDNSVILEGSILSVCGECKHAISVSGLGQELFKENPEAIRICSSCIAEHMPDEKVRAAPGIKENLVKKLGISEDAAEEFIEHIESLTIAELQARLEAFESKGNN